MNYVGASSPNLGLGRGETLSPNLCSAVPRMRLCAALTLSGPAGASYLEDLMILDSFNIASSVRMSSYGSW